VAEIQNSPGSWVVDFEHFASNLSVAGSQRLHDPLKFLIYRYCPTMMHMNSSHMTIEGLYENHPGTVSFSEFYKI
jgi:hypothetical protein